LNLVSVLLRNHRVDQSEGHQDGIRSLDASDTEGHVRNPIAVVGKLDLTSRTGRQFEGRNFDAVRLPNPYIAIVALLGPIGPEPAYDAHLRDTHRLCAEGYTSDGRLLDRPGPDRIAF